jgi:hypothetical protein
MADTIIRKLMKVTRIIKLTTHGMKISSWVSDLKLVHEGIVADVEFVEEKWRKGFEVLGGEWGNEETKWREN